MKKPLVALLVATIVVGCHPKEPAAARSATSKPASATVLEFVETIAMADSLRFLELVEKDTMFAYFSHEQGGFTEEFSANKVYAPYFFLFGIWKKGKDHPETIPNPIRHFCLETLSESDSVVSYMCRWQPYYYPSEDFIEQDFRLRKGNEWKIVYATPYSKTMVEQDKGL
jgi:hypothetical protein